MHVKQCKECGADFVAPKAILVFCPECMWDLVGADDADLVAEYADLLRVGWTRLGYPQPPTGAPPRPTHWPTMNA